METEPRPAIPDFKLAIATGVIVGNRTTVQYSLRSVVGFPGHKSLHHISSFRALPIPMVASYICKCQRWLPTNALFREPDWGTYTYKHFLYICLLKDPAACVRLLIWQGSTRVMTVDIQIERRPLSYLITAPGTAGDQRLTIIVLYLICTHRTWLKT